MQYLFYLLAIPALFYNIAVLKTPAKFEGFYKFRKESKGKKESEINTPKSYQLFASLLIVYTLWLFVGILSSQWICFLTLIYITLIPIRKWWYRYLTAAVSAPIILFIVINKFHLHINLWALIVKQFQ